MSSLIAGFIDSISYFLLPVPSFELLFSGHSLLNLIKFLQIDQPVGLVAASEARGQLVLVLVYSSTEIVCHPDVELPTTTSHVNVEGLSLHTALRTNHAADTMAARDPSTQLAAARRLRMTAGGGGTVRMRSRPFDLQGRISWLSLEMMNCSPSRRKWTIASRQA